MFKGKTDPSQTLHGNHNQQAGGDITNYTIYEAPEQILTRLPSLMTAAALRLAATIQSTPSPPSQTPSPYNINQKIEYNSVRAYRRWIDDYGVYGFAVDAAYNGVDATIPGSRTKILRHIWTKYTDIRADLVLQNIASITAPEDEILVIRKNADNIIHAVRQIVIQEIKASPEQGLVVEDVNFSANAITCHAFIHCHILDRPPS